MAQIARFFMSQNNGVRALLSEEHLDILNECFDENAEKTIELCHERGVRWYCFVTVDRMVRNEDPAIPATGTYGQLQELGTLGWLSLGLASFHVPLSNGPQHWEATKHLVGSWDELMKELRAMRPKE